VNLVQNKLLTPGFLIARVAQELAFVGAAVAREKE
jgi:hypothetical protein